jgi:hypothetical protein
LKERAKGLGRRRPLKLQGIFLAVVEDQERFRSDKMARPGREIKGRSMLYGLEAERRAVAVDAIMCRSTVK